MRASCGTSALATPFCDTTPNPNPHRFEIVDAELINGHTLLYVRYPNCTTFNGMKLLLLRGFNIYFTKLDPHFLNDPKHPVVARFIPNEDGYKMAVAAANSL